MLSLGKAAVFRRYPFTIILKEVIHKPSTATYRVKLDPGSRVTGLVVLNDKSAEVVYAAEIEHRGIKIKAAMDSRRALRRGRRSRKTRYRKPRFLNRTRPDKWLPPSLESRISNIITWVERIKRLCPLTEISQELVKFDMQQLENPEISGVEYQQGELFGYEVREYLLEKFGRKCAYCGRENVPLEIEHITPKSRGGTNRVNNLTIACHECNERKGNRTAAEYGHPEVEANARKPLRDAAAINAIRWKLYDRLKTTGLPIETGSGGRTKFNRIRLGLAKEHWIDAACVGVSTPGSLNIKDIKVLQIVAFGHGRRQRCMTNKYGFPVAHAKREKSFMGFQTGDIVKAIVPKGKNAGIHVGRIAIRYKPSFHVGKLDGIHPKYMKILQRADGYGYL